MNGESEPTTATGGPIAHMKTDMEEMEPCPERSIVAEYFDSEYYLQTNQDVAHAGVDPLTHFLEVGWREQRKPAAWFDAASYALQSAFLDHRSHNAFVHLIVCAKASGATPYDLYHSLCNYVDMPLQAEWERKPVAIRMEEPSRKVKDLVRPHFDAEYYLRINQDVARVGVNPMTHFLTIGWIEGRNPSPDFSISYYLKHNSDVRRAGINPFVHYLENRKRETWRKTSSVAAAHVLTKFEPGQELAKQVCEAMSLEPMLGFPREPRRITSPMLATSELRPVLRKLRSHFQDAEYPYIVMIPHIRMSGAARVASIFTSVLARTVGAEKILVLVTDGDETPYAHWFPDDVRLFNLHDEMQPVSIERRVQLLIDLLRGVNAQYLININSLLAWRSLDMYGRQLSQEFNLITYLFTWDETPEGLRGGYPIQWLRNTTDFHHLLLTDTGSLAQDICERFGYGPDDVRALGTPIGEAQATAQRPDASASPHFLWAGRFDPQKRFDVLTGIARQSPHVTFDVYGQAVLDAQGAKQHNPPTNMHFMGTYTKLSDVFQKPYHGFVYTAQWDGMPTIILDMAQAGLPIIAPKVGGIGELIDADTGWLIEDFTDVDSYRAAMDEIFRNPHEAARRSAQLQLRVAERYSEDHYRRELQKALKLND